jgi:phenylalanyl-tRNA synthetase beta chain
MKVPLSWIREFVDVKATADEIGTLMGVRGLALEGLETHGDDVVLDFDVTANRPDCMSVIGLAREIATAYDLPMRSDGRSNNRSDERTSERPPERTSERPPERSSERPSERPLVTIEAPDLCARYVGAAADVTVGPSPRWMQDRLMMCGVRPISNIVDITNYVLLELGHPMHAFDAAKLRGGEIRVRCAQQGESITTLDGKARTLSADMLVIADAERAEAIGGVMGGADSEVTSATRQIVFEAAWFKPTSVRATSKKLNLKTEASMRFERGMDLTAPDRATARALQLLQQIGAGKAVGAITDAYPKPFEPKTMRLDRARIGGLLGMDVPDTAVERILMSLGFAISRTHDPSPKTQVPSPKTQDPRPKTSSGWNVIPPPWRVDMHRQVDLVEEVGRHYGFEHLPATFPGVEQAPPPSDPRIARDRRVRTALLGMGFSEAITFGFIEAAAAEPYLNGQPPVGLSNPLSEKFALMRPSLLPGLVDVLSHNRRHGRPDVRVFEIGTRFTPAGESRGAAFAWMGLGTPDHWSGASRPADFSDIKGVVEQLAALASVTVTFTEVDRTFLVRGRAANILINGRVIGGLGQLAPEIGEARDLPATSEVYVAELNLDAVTAASPIETRHATTLPRFPFVVRDVSILVANTLSAETVRGTIRSAAPDTLVQVREFDRYEGKGVPDGKVSLSFRLTFQSPERTLTDDEVSAAMTSMVTALKQVHGAEQR